MMKKEMILVAFATICGATTALSMEQSKLVKQNSQYGVNLQGFQRHRVPLYWSTQIDNMPKLTRTSAEQNKLEKRHATMQQAQLASIF